MDLKFQYRSRS